MTKTAGAKGLIQCIQTAKDTGERLARRSPLAFSGGEAQSTIAVDPGSTHQTMLGFGGAFTEAGAYALSRLSAEKRAEVIRAYFDPVAGSRYSLCRTHINSCDFSLGNYSYNDRGEDHALEHFDIGHDRELLIPFIRDAQAVSDNGFTLLASPWSPPAWMKTNGEMNNGGRLKDNCRDTWARYIAKYIDAYRHEGIPIWGITVQNEPDAVQRWDSCVFSAEEERDFVKLHLGPTLAAEGLEQVKILVWDHNKDLIVERARTILGDPEAARYVWGVGFHWYTGDYFDNLAEVHQAFPDKHLVFTEGCHEGGVRLGAWEMGEKYAHSIIGDVNHGTAGWIDWNMVLDSRGGPNHVGNFCDAPVIADGETDTVHYQNGYYYLAHFSRFATPGALRIGVHVEGSHLESTAFRNPDGTIAVIVLNRSDELQAYVLCDSGRSVRVNIPARAIQTLTYDAGE